MSSAAVVIGALSLLILNTYMQAEVWICDLFEVTIQEALRYSNFGPSDHMPGTLPSKVLLWLSELLLLNETRPVHVHDNIYALWGFWNIASINPPDGLINGYQQNT